MAKLRRLPIHPGFVRKRWLLTVQQVPLDYFGQPIWKYASQLTWPVVESTAYRRYRSAEKAALKARRSAPIGTSRRVTVSKLP